MVKFAGSLDWSKIVPVCMSVYPSTSVPESLSSKISLTMLALALSLGATVTGLPVCV